MRVRLPALLTIVIAVSMFVCAASCGSKETKGTRSGSNAAAKPVDKTATAAETPREADAGYFPLKVGSRYFYLKRYRDQREANVTLVVRPFKATDGTDGFYFEDVKEVAPGKDPTVSFYFGFGAFFVVNDTVYTIEAQHRSDLDKLDSTLKQALIRFPVKPGTVFNLPTGGKASRYVVEGFEDVKVKAGSFDNSLKITLEYVGQNVPKSTIWLARGVGVVKVLWQNEEYLELLTYSMGD